MTAATGRTLPEDHELSLFALGALLLRNRWRIARWSFAGGVLAALSVISKPALYSADFSFVSQGADAARSSLANLAGQLGITTSSGGQTQSPDFYVGLIRSRELLKAIATDTFVVAEQDNRRMTFMDLFETPQGPPARREEDAIRSLRTLVNPGVNKTTNVIQVSVATKWPSVSLQIASAVLKGINEFNLRTRQSQAGAERKFIESQMNTRRSDLRAAEDRLVEFTNTNRGGLSPQQSLLRDRLQREVLSQQQVYNAMAQAFDDAQIREVRDTPTISVIEPPSASTYPEPRGRAKRGLLGLLMGAMVGVVLVFASAALARRRDMGDPDASAFLSAVRDVNGELLGRLRRSKATTP